MVAFRRPTSLKDMLVHSELLIDVSIKLIDKVAEETKLQDREGKWAYRLKSLQPHGLNKVTFSLAKTEGQESGDVNLQCFSISRVFY